MGKLGYLQRDTARPRPGFSCMGSFVAERRSRAVHKSFVAQNLLLRGLQLRSQALPRLSPCRCLAHSAGAGTRKVAGDRSSVPRRRRSSVRAVPEKREVDSLLEYVGGLTELEYADELEC